MRKWADATDEPNEKYRDAHVWYDKDKKDNFTAYKLLIADVVGGDLKVVPRGVMAAGAIMDGARGGIDLPEGDIDRVKSHLAKYYEKMGDTAPWSAISYIAGVSNAAGRFAPSPSADLHIGNLRTAVLAWLFARSTGRRFLVRVEDLDDRTFPEIGRRQVADLAAVGLTWDEPVEWQTTHEDRYDAVIDQLAGEGLLYECYCSRKDIAQAPRAPHAPQGAYPARAAT